MIAGDFNMVCSITDRWNVLGNTLSGEERQYWENTTLKFDIVDVSPNTGITWTNNQSGANFRAARLDRFYCSNDLVKDFLSMEDKALNSINISDHKPVMLDCNSQINPHRVGWLHVDQSLFKLNSVKKSIMDIFLTAFSTFRSIAKAWASAVSNSQTCLRQFKHQANTIRAKKRQSISNEIQKLHNSLLPDNPPTPELISLNNELRLEELLEAQRALVFTREFWAGKIDKPNQDMFRLLKQKQAKDTVPNLINDIGDTLTEPQDNLNYVFDFYNTIFGSCPSTNTQKTQARANIARVREHTINDFMRSSLDAPITLEEIKQSMLSLANGKSPGIDGLPNEFYKTYCTFLAPFLLMVWHESLHFRALPTCVNTGVVKLIHKRGSRNRLNNWRPMWRRSKRYAALSFARGEPG